MDESTFRTNLNTLREMILDENKLVTYVSLSKELCIHVNDSKSLLRKIVEDSKTKQPTVDLNVTYILSGLSEDYKARTTVCLEEDIEKIKKSLKSVFFEHIYSISKGFPAIDNAAFLATNKFEDLPLCIGLIKSSLSSKRSTKEIGDLKSHSQERVNVEEKQTLSKKPKEELKNEEKCKIGASNSNTITKIHETKSEPIIKTDLSPKKDVPNKSKEIPDVKKNGHKSQKGIAGFFSRSNSTPAKKVKTENVEVKQEVAKGKDSIVEQPIVKAEKMDVVHESIPEKVAIKAVKKENVTLDKPKSKSLNQIRKTAKVDKKRKRVLHVSDSESEDEKNDPFVDEPMADNESEDEIPPTPSVNMVKITSGIVNPKKRRKIVDKTYMDEEGYIMTKKEEVYESCSENEEEMSIKENVQVEPVKLLISPKNKKNAAKATKKKMLSPQKGKQATMMNFFKKV